jgi:hypothetical protein
MKPLLTAALVLASLCAHSQTLDNPSGNIKGTVTEQNGNPVFEATVYAVPQDLTLDGISTRAVRTDKHGAFDFTGGLPWGNYKLYTCKDKDGYPNPLDGFYADSQPNAVQVELREDNPFAEVPVTLGEKAGIITGRVLDADTGTPVKARVTFWREDRKGDHGVTSRSKDGEYRALVPPREDVIVMVVVSSPTKEHAAAPLPSLRLEPGQEIVMDIPISTK